MNTQPSIIRFALGLLALLSAVTFASAEESKERKPSKETLEKYDANKDGTLDESEKAAWNADIAAKTKATKEANLAKYDLNKDGKLDDSEKAAMKADEAAAKETKKAEKAAAKEAKKAEKEAKK